MFWYTILSFIVGASLASLALSGTQRLAMISLIPIGMTSPIADSMPRFFVKNLWYGYCCAIVWGIVTIIALKQLPYDPKLDFHLPIFGTYNLTGVAISALYNYIIMMTKLFVVSVWNPKNFIMLKVPLQSTKMMENRANMILVTAEKEKMYKKIGEDGQKLITAIVGSPSDVPWEFNEKTSKSMLFSRFRMDKKHQVTSDMEFKLEFYAKKSLEQTYREIHTFKEYKVIYEEISNKANALLSMRILYRRIKVPYPGVSDRLVCIKSQYRYYPEHEFAFVVTQDAEKNYADQIPKEVTEGTVRMKCEDSKEKKMNSSNNRRCKICRKMKSRDDFSGSQWRRRPELSRCKECTDINRQQSGDRSRNNDNNNTSTRGGRQVYDRDHPSKLKSLSKRKVDLKKVHATADLGYSSGPNPYEGRLAVLEEKRRLMPCVGDIVTYKRASAATGRLTKDLAVIRSVDPGPPCPPEYYTIEITVSEDKRRQGREVNCLSKSKRLKLKYRKGREPVIKKTKQISAKVSRLKSDISNQTEVEELIRAEDNIHRDQSNADLIPRKGEEKSSKKPFHRPATQQQQNNYHDIHNNDILTSEGSTSESESSSDSDEDSDTPSPLGAKEEGREEKKKKMLIGRSPNKEEDFNDGGGPTNVTTSTRLMEDCFSSGGSSSSGGDDAEENKISANNGNTNNPNNNEDEQEEGDRHFVNDSSWDGEENGIFSASTDKSTSGHHRDIPYRSQYHHVLPSPKRFAGDVDNEKENMMCSIHHKRRGAFGSRNKEIFIALHNRSILCWETRKDAMQGEVPSQMIRLHQYMHVTHLDMEREKLGGKGNSKCRVFCFSILSNDGVAIRKFRLNKFSSRHDFVKLAHFMTDDQEVAFQLHSKISKHLERIQKNGNKQYRLSTVWKPKLPLEKSVLTRHGRSERKAIADVLIKDARRYGECAESVMISETSTNSDIDESSFLTKKRSSNAYNSHHHRSETRASNYSSQYGETRGRRFSSIISNNDGATANGTGTVITATKSSMANTDRVWKVKRTKTGMLKGMIRVRKAEDSRKKRIYSGSEHKTWKSRYFTIQGAVLMIFKDKHEFMSGLPPEIRVFVTQLMHVTPIKTEHNALCKEVVSSFSLYVNLLNEIKKHNLQTYDNTIRKATLVEVNSPNLSAIAKVHDALTTIIHHADSSDEEYTS
eukprot:g3364.t1